VEVAFPLLDDALRAEVRQLLDFQRHGNVKARDFDNYFLLPEPAGAPRVRAQEATYQWLKKRKRR